ncbi:right-handed parallel beta-helix repeat-containing protein [Thiocystis violacea]|uniref:right-handed parallel beta-helix repeat-containing protein n=1 Tax=Thiocystis violacea TaxID=13725 RepID=UPI00190412DC
MLYNNNIWGGRCDNCAGGISGIEFGDPYGGVTVNNVTVSTNRIHDNTGAGFYLNVGTSMPYVGFSDNSLYNNTLGCSLAPTGYQAPPCQ